MKIKVITDSEELEQFTSREDITISKIDVRSCEQSSFAQQWFVAVVMYEESTGDNFDWQSFRAETAKDILCSIIQSYGEDRIENQSELAVEYADELIKQLKEKEAK
jgi:hypothetical protein